MLAGVDEILGAVDDGRPAGDVVAAADGDVDRLVVGHELRVLAVQVGQRDDDVTLFLVLELADQLGGLGEVVVPPRCRGCWCRGWSRRSCRRSRQKMPNFRPPAVTGDVIAERIGLLTFIDLASRNLVLAESMA